MHKCLFSHPLWILVRCLEFGSSPTLHALGWNRTGACCWSLEYCCDAGWCGIAWCGIAGCGGMVWFRADCGAMLNKQSAGAVRRPVVRCDILHCVDWLSDSKLFETSLQLGIVHTMVAKPPSNTHKAINIELFHAQATELVATIRQKCSSCTY